jgi:hypothetical protein
MNFLTFVPVITFQDLQRKATFSATVSENSVECIDCVDVCLQTIASGMWTILETILLGIFLLYSTVRTEIYCDIYVYIAISC